MSLFCLFVVFYLVMSAANIITNINYILMLNASNFKSWQEKLLTALAFINLDFALGVDSLLSLIEESTLDDKRKI